VLSRDEIVAALKKPVGWGDEPIIYYQLTAKGAGQWEAFAKPDWDRYVLNESDSETGDGQLTCLDEQWLQCYLENFSAIEGCVDRASVQHQHLGPWQATYWKVLPSGYRVQFRYTSGWPENDEARDLRDGLALNGFNELHDQWYRWQ
jgi:hypothetical protein